MHGTSALVILIVLKYIRERKQLPPEKKKSTPHTHARSPTILRPSWPKKTGARTPLRGLADARTVVCASVSLQKRVRRTPENIWLVSQRTGEACAWE